MSSESEYIAKIALAEELVFKIGGPILITIGTISCIIEFLVLHKKNYHKNPCSYYLIAYNIANFLLIYTSLLMKTLIYGYDIRVDISSEHFCRFFYYALMVFDVLCPSYLILASIDRILITSRNALTRQRSTMNLAYISIGIVTLFWLGFHSQMLFFTSVFEVVPNYIVCYFELGIYLTFISYYSFLVKGIIIPVILIILSFLTIKNIQKVGRIFPNLSSQAHQHQITNISHVTRQNDHHLIKILVINILIYIVFSLLLSIVLVIGQIQQYQPKTLSKAELQSFLLNLGLFNSYIPFCIVCYVNMLVSKTFRKEVKKIITNY